MEIELRAKISNEKLLEEKLKKLSGIMEKKSGERQVDLYFKHEGEENEKMIIRIRKNYENNKAILTFKSKSKYANDIAWQDFDTPIVDPDRLEELLLNSGYVYFCLVDKVRQSFSYKEFEINIDNIRDLGLFIEIEKNGTKNEVEAIRKQIIDLLVLLGVAENTIINKGYVQLMVSKK
jgi:adenylate cyclase class 2